MFPRRFFAGTFFAPRYYPQSLGDTPAAPATPTDCWPLYLSQLITQGLAR